MFSPDEQRLVTDSENTFILWDTATGERLRSFPDTFGEFQSLPLSPDGRLLAYRTLYPADAPVTLWDVRLDRQVRTMAAPFIDFNGAFSSTGQFLAAGGDEGPVMVWDVATGKVVHALRGHTDYVRSLSFNSDDTRLTTANNAGTTIVRDVQTGAALYSLPGGNTIETVQFSPDGRRLYVGDTDGTVRGYLVELADLVTLARSRLTRTLTPEECREYLHVEACPAGP